MTGPAPYFVFGSPGGELRFPTQNGRPVAISREAWEECCCEGGPCEVCAAATLAEWTMSHGFPTEDVGTLPYVLDGTTTAGTTILGNITSDGASIGQDGINPAAFSDASVIIFPVVRKNFILSYEYNTTTGKHWMNVQSNPTLASHCVLAGSWAGSPLAAAILRVGLLTSLFSFCIDEFPPAEIPTPSLPQGSGVWLTRELTKSSRALTIGDGVDPPFALTRCFFPVRGYLSLTLGPGVRIRNVSILPRA